jgi:Skp family chaperone for outer membrane proteins
LTEAELRIQAEKMAQNLSQIAQYEADLKSIKKQIESDIARCQADLGSAVEKFRSGFEMRNVDCEVKKDFETNTVRTYRLDTGEMIRERALTAEERQLMLDLEKKEEAPAGEEKPGEDLPDTDAGHPFYNDEKKEAEATE